MVNSDIASLVTILHRQSIDSLQSIDSCSAEYKSITTNLNPEHIGINLQSNSPIALMWHQHISILLNEDAKQQSKL